MYMNTLLSSSYTNECVHKCNNDGIYFKLHNRPLPSSSRQNAAPYVKLLDLFPIAIRWFVCCSLFNFAFTKINYFHIPVMICATFIRHLCLCFNAKSSCLSAPINVFFFVFLSFCGEFHFGCFFLFAFI